LTIAVLVPPIAKTLSEESTLKALALPVNAVSVVVQVHAKDEGAVVPSASALLILPINGYPASLYPPDLKCMLVIAVESPVYPPTTKPPSLVNATVSTPEPVPWFISQTMLPSDSFNLTICIILPLPDFLIPAAMT
jgi:hypothetical protein